MSELNHSHSTGWQPHHAPVSADDIVVQVTDLLFDYLPPESGISPEEAVARVRTLIDSPVGMAAYVSDAMVSGVGADDIVVQLADALDQASPDPRETIGRLLEVVEGPLAIEIYDREMERRRPRDADRWH